MLAHNHHNGIAVPSSEDMEFTDTLKIQLEEIDVILVDHLIFAEDWFDSVMRSRGFGFHSAPKLKKEEDAADFYDRFYENLESAKIHQWKR